MIFTIIHFFIEQRFCKYYFFMDMKINNWKDAKINHANIYYLIYCGAKEAFGKIMQHKET